MDQHNCRSKNSLLNKYDHWFSVEVFPANSFPSVPTICLKVISRDNQRATVEVESFQIESHNNNNNNNKQQFFG